MPTSTDPCSRRRRLAAGLVVFVATACATAQTVSGFGAHKCKDYLAAVEKGQKAAIDGYISWAQGYLSAWNATNPERRDVQADPDGLTYWLVDRCGQSRAESFYAAVRAFISVHAR